MGELMLGLTAYMIFYNEERVHQSLGYGTPSEVYETDIGGGATIVDKFGGARGEAKTETTTTATTTATTTKKPGQRRAAACKTEFAA